jgi:hypothetical protein
VCPRATCYVPWLRDLGDQRVLVLRALRGILGPRQQGRGSVPLFAAPSVAVLGPRTGGARLAASTILGPSEITLSTPKAPRPNATPHKPLLGMRGACHRWSFCEEITSQR